MNDNRPAPPAWLPREALQRTIALERLVGFVRRLGWPGRGDPLKKASEADDAAEARMPLIPPEISLDVLRTSPDFDAADAKTREIGFGGGFIPPWIIQGAIEHAEHGASAEIIERNRTDFTMRM